MKLSLNNRSLLLIASFAILFLFLIQSAGVLVESIYIMDLMNSKLDEKAAGVLFFFAPVLLLLLGKRKGQHLTWVLTVLLILARGLFPYLDTLGRMLASGFALMVALLLIPIGFINFLKDDQANDWLIPAQGLALAATLSILMRTLNASLDLSIEAGSAWLGWILGLALAGIMLVLPQEKVPAESPAPADGHRVSLAAPVGLFTIFVLAHFAFFSPGVIARWTYGSYPLIISLVSGLTLLGLFIIYWKPQLVERISSRIILAWNLFFTLSLSSLIFSHTPSFPSIPESAPVIVVAPTIIQKVLLLITLLLFPVIFLDFAIFSRVIVHRKPTPAKIAPGFLLGALLWVILIFMNIFTNVWGYVEPISPFFRGKYWLPFLLACGTATILAWCFHSRHKVTYQATNEMIVKDWKIPALVLGIIFLLTCSSALLTEHPQSASMDVRSLTVMTYNIQQANDIDGEKSYLQQLALIRKINPDILALQEIDSARISLGNNDYLRYFANKLKDYEFYGPTTVTGTYGTALLAKYPLENVQIFFTFSDQDEVGVTQAEVVVDGLRFTIFCVHPDGSDLADQAFADALLEQAAGKDNVIALGDYNLRDYEPAYQRIDEVFQNAWTTLYPTGINDQGLDMSGKNRIDHIFISQHLTVLEAYYLLPPESATDHPVHWAKLSWK
jgi:endonuclease/exonuclease/phosphatase family metal-dependent hydrolase